MLAQTLDGACHGYRMAPINLLVTSDHHPVYDPAYPARRVLHLIADKWTPIILYCLSGGTRRF